MQDFSALLNMNAQNASTNPTDLEALLALAQKKQADENTLPLPPKEEVIDPNLPVHGNVTLKSSPSAGAVLAANAAAAKPVVTNKTGTKNIQKEEQDQTIANATSSNLTQPVFGGVNKVGPNQFASTGNLPAGMEALFKKYPELIPQYKALEEEAQNTQNIRDTLMTHRMPAEANLQPLQNLGAIWGNRAQPMPYEAPKAESLKALLDYQKQVETAQKAPGEMLAKYMALAKGTAGDANKFGTTNVFKSGTTNEQDASNTTKTGGDAKMNLALAKFHNPVLDKISDSFGLAQDLYDTASKPGNPRDRLMSSLAAIRTMTPRITDTELKAITQGDPTISNIFNLAMDKNFDAKTLTDEDVKGYMQAMLNTAKRVSEIANNKFEETIGEGVEFSGQDRNTIAEKYAKRAGRPSYKSIGDLIGSINTGVGNVNKEYAKTYPEIAKQNAEAEAIVKGTKVNSSKEKEEATQALKDLGIIK